MLTLRHFPLRTVGAAWSNRCRQTDLFLPPKCRESQTSTRWSWNSPASIRDRSMFKPATLPGDQRKARMSQDSCHGQWGDAQQAQSNEAKQATPLPASQLRPLEAQPSSSPFRLSATASRPVTRRPCSPSRPKAQTHTSRDRYWVED